MRQIDRFDEYMTLKKLNDNKVTNQLGFSVGTIGKSRGEGRDLSKRAVQRILAVYNDLDENWLKTGEGEMICEPRNTKLGLYGKPENDVNVIELSHNSGSTLDRLIELMSLSSNTISRLNDQIATAHGLIASEQKIAAKAQEQITKQQEIAERYLTMIEIERGLKPKDITKD